jgi:type II secretory pathway component PulF
MQITLIIVALTIVGLPLLLGVAWTLQYLVSLPLRRREKMRVLLDLIEDGLRHGHTPEQTLRAWRLTRDASLGRAAARLADAVAGGKSFADAIEAESGVFPASVRMMLRSGHQAGNLELVIPACRGHLDDALGEVRSAHDYLIVLALGVSPFWVLIFLMLSVFVFPKFAQIATDMGGHPPGLFAFMMQHHGWLVWVQAVVMTLCYAGATLYLGGPKLHAWLDRRLPGLNDWLAARVPWRRLRLTRDFSSMLGILLDAGVPEPRALQLAAESTANRPFERLAHRAQEALARGTALPEALRLVDKSGQLAWRLRAAASTRDRFMTALAGWHEALDAEAFQREQAASQCITVALVVLNGFFVGLLAVSVFGWLIHLVEIAPLW